MDLPVTTLPFLVSVTEPEPDYEDDGSKGLFGGSRPIARTDVVLRKELDVDTLRASLNRLCHGLAQVFQDAKQVGGFRLTEVTLAVEVGAEGGFELIGTGKVSGKGAITLKFAEKAEG